LLTLLLAEFRQYITLQAAAKPDSTAFQMLNSLRMRTDILPLCDQHFRAMEPMLAPYNADYSIEFFSCTD